VVLNSIIEVHPLVGWIRGGASEQQVPHRAFGPIRNDIPFLCGETSSPICVFALCQSGFCTVM
jgi:hypothetical protein